jgi:hypothetical protein
MSATAIKPANGQPQILATYQSNEGTRQVVGQRINGTVAVSDIPAGDQGKVYLIERRVSSMDELDGIVSDYCELAAQLGRPPMQRDWIFEN